MRAEQLGHGRLAVGAGHGDERRVGQQAPGQLELADHRDATLAAASITGASFGTPGDFTTVRARSSSSRPSDAEVKLDAAGARPPLGRAGVGADHLAVLAQHRAPRDPRARQADQRDVALKSIECVLPEVGIFAGGEF